MTGHGILERLLTIPKSQNVSAPHDVDTEVLDGVPTDKQAQNQAVDDRVGDEHRSLCEHDWNCHSRAIAKDLHCQTCRS